MKILHSIIFMAVMAIVASLPGQMLAQTHYESNIAVGAKAGATVSMMSFLPSVQQSVILGSTFGVTFRYMEEKHFGLIAEVNFVQRGWKEKFEDTPQYSFQRRLTYVQVPFLTHIYFGSHKFRGFFNAGPELGFMIADTHSANFDINDLPDFQDPYRTIEQFGAEIQSKFDYGISAGLGMEFIANNKHSFIFEARYYFGIGNIFGSSKTDYFSASRGMSIMATLGYMFRLK